MFSTTPGNPVFFAGTFNGHPPTTAAALATIDKLQREPVHEHVFALGERTRQGLRELYARLGVTCARQRLRLDLRHLLPRRHPDELRRPARERRRSVHGLPPGADESRDLRAAAQPEAQSFLVGPHRRRRRSPARGDRGGGPDRACAARMSDPAVACTIDLAAPGKQVGRLQFAEDLEHRRLGLRLRPDRDDRERRGPDGARLRRQPRRRVRRPDRRAPTDQRDRCGAGPADGS